VFQFQPQGEVFVGDFMVGVLYSYLHTNFPFDLIRLVHHMFLESYAWYSMSVSGTHRIGITCNNIGLIRHITSETCVSIIPCIP